MAEQRRLSRRGFVKPVSATNGVAALPAYGLAQAAQAPAPASPLSLRNTSQFPGLTPRGAGWLNFLLDKATTKDDWSSAAFEAAEAEPPLKPRVAAAASVLASTETGAPGPNPFAMSPGCPCCASA